MRTRESEEAMIKSASLILKLMIAWGVAVVLIIFIEGAWGLPFPPNENTLHKILFDSFLGVVGAIVGLSIIGLLRRQLGRNCSIRNK